MPNSIAPIAKQFSRTVFNQKDYIYSIDNKGNVLFLNRRGESIYSFIMVSQKENKEAINLRFKFLSDMEFVDTTPTLADIIYKEFKGLEFQRQTDHEGMLYMLSAWSHAQSRLEFIKASIGFLERGEDNQKQLSPLYSYMFKRLGRTFAKKGVTGLELDSDVKLKHMIELEKKNKEAHTLLRFIADLVSVPFEAQRKSLSRFVDER